MGKSWYERFRLALTPAGGSLVILTPFCRIVTGKCGDGMLVSHSLKSGSVVSTLMLSTIFSRFGIQLAARWQFCRSAQVPFLMASSIMTAALGPWPWPMEITDTCTQP